MAVKGQLITIPEGYAIEVSAQPLEKTELHNVLLAPSARITVEEDASGNKTIRDEYRPDAVIYGTDALFPGQLASGQAAGYMRDQRVASISFYPVQYNPVTRLLVLHKKYRVFIRFKQAADNTSTAASMVQRVARPSTATAEKAFNRIYAATLLNYAPVKESSGALQQPKSAVTMQTQAAAGVQKVKATITDEGIYKITYEDLSALGVDLSAATNENLRVENQGTEVAAYRSGSGPFKAGDYILFYGVPFKS